MIWDKEKECIDREDLKQLQLERLQSTIHRVYRNVPFYRRMFDKQGIDPDSFSSIEDIKKIPFTTKNDLRENYPYGLFAVPLREVVRIHTSSGTTGMPIVVGYTRGDLKIWSELVARVLSAGGITKDDVIQIAFNYGLFTGAFGFHYGAEKIGASVIPISIENPKKQIKIMQDYKTTALISTPSYALLIANTILEIDINPNSLSLKFGLFGAEPWSERMRKEIEEKLKITATDNYGLSEVMGPGVAGECLEKNGLHINEDHFLFEIIDPHTLEPLEEGQTGELVITTLTKEAFPVLRFRTGDLTRFLPGQCPCGRTFRRIDRIMGRTDDMIIIRGLKIFPSQIEAILYEIEGKQPNYQIILERQSGVDNITILLEVTEDIFSDVMKEQSQLINILKDRLSSEFGLSFNVKLAEKRSLEKVDGKLKRVIDKRN
ncbi:MAG: phenylacetate--CoA ligase [Thermodesulfovibrio sp.]|uniref:phenylacetate--CoA ligase family protein n=1 Tax=unclassified Thermodesulfovibrio TaxID=2645936 RepID=UPI00083A16A6|nr:MULTISPECIES: phenylacetate--CoA ligase [unclassified Thermodesulfovibrio]MDI1471186.1 phenylacetate--CoA ligase [Thermodesulfovibrio sp. 1176]MDI6715270.1 phenylacetate--CoA ligase [Thermodesulfovibrio sp.]ODA45045.1 Phenylacetate-coenzyme A ligase [Thermodesulfovibrio sp. N1]